MISLSPAARRGIFHHLIARDTKEAAEQKRERDLDRVEEVTMYRCTECDQIHHDEDDAVDCCAPDAVAELHDQEAPGTCPVCGQDFMSARDAADCCLWKDLDAPTRWRMADQVDAGSTTWSQLLGVSA